MFDICITPRNTMRLYQHGQPVTQVDEERLKEWVEHHYDRPWPPRIRLTEQAAVAMCEWLRRFP